MSPTPDSTLADPQQVIADLERKLAEAERRLDECTAERDDSEAQKAAIAEVLEVINSSPGDLAPVFDTMVQKAVQLCEASFGIMSTYDGERFHGVARHSVPAPYTEFMGQDPPQPSPHSALGRIRGGERLVHIEDYARDQAEGASDPRRRALAELGGARSYVAVGLFKDDRLLGTLAAYRQEVRPFTGKQIALLQNFAAQAVIAMENARLLTETKEALEQQTATSEVFQVINSSPGDLAPVFSAMLEKATNLCEAAYGTLFTYDGELFYAVALRGVPAVFADALAAPVRPEPGAALDRLVRGEFFADCADVANEASYRGPAGRVLVELGGARSTLAVPLRKDNVLLGAFAIYRQEVRPFSEKQITLLQNFAAQAVIAMENARLLGDLRERTGDLEEALEQQTATAEVLGVINSSPGDLAPVFDAILEKAHILCGSAFGSLQLYDNGKFRAVAVRGMPDSLAELLRQPIDPLPGAPPTRLLGGERIVQVADIAAYAEQRPDDPRTQVSTEHGLRTALFVPLRRDADLLGYITAFRQEVRPFTDKQIALLQNFAAQAVIAMENARLITETREALEQQTATAEVLGVINSSPGDLAPVFEAMLERAVRLCELDFATLWTYDGTSFYPVAKHRVPEPLWEYLQEHTPPAFARLVGGDRLVHIPDVQGALEQTDFSRNVRRLGLDTVRSLLIIPLRKDTTLLGLIGAYRREVRPFSDKQITLLQNFAAEAVIAIENARLITETREALDQQTATAEVLGVINSSPGDLAPVFETMVERANRLCEADMGTLWTFDGKAFHPAVASGFTNPAVGAIRKGYAPRPGTTLGRIVQGEDVVHLLDVASDPSYQPDADADAHARTQLAGTRTTLAIALRKDNRLLGAITTGRRIVRAYSDKQIALLQNFAAQAVIAMENARLLGELRQRTEEVGELNRGLEERVAEQVDELGRVGRLKRFLAPQLAELIVSQGDEKILESHRREIVVVFCDLRGYTAFTEAAEPEEVLDFLREYHGALGPLVAQFEGTLDQFSGDGIMVFFNDPVPIPDPAERAVKMAVAMREAAGTLITSWRRRRGRALGFGVGIAEGYATLGQIGFAERSGYTAIGTVCNLAARLCAEAKDGQILLAQRVAVAVEETTPVEEVGELTLRGLTQPVVAYNVPLAASQPALRVIEGGPQSV